MRSFRNPEEGGVEEKREEYTVILRLLMIDEGRAHTG